MTLWALPRLAAPLVWKHFAAASSNNAQSLANTAWAFATVKRSDERLLTAVARAAERRVSEFNAQSLANTAWAFATLKRPDEELFMALAGAAERRVSKFNAQELANMAWAFAAVKRPDENSSRPGQEQQSDV